MHIPYITYTLYSYTRDDRLFYFLDFCTNPLDVSFSIRLFGHIINIMTDNLLDELLP